MIQRVQSIFLLCVAISMGLMLNFKIWEKGSLEKDNNEQVIITAFQQTHVRIDVNENDNESRIEETRATFAVGILASLAVIVALYSIFQYKNRLTQMKLGALNSLLIAGAMMLSLYYAMQAEKILLPNIQGAYRLGFFMPIAALLFNLLSNRFIRKDEKLVKSVDRLR
jgi:hypothetical protein